MKTFAIFFRVTGSYFSPLSVSLMAQMVKNSPAKRETWVRSLGWEDPLEKGIATQSIILAWTFPVDRGAWQAFNRDV